MQIINHTGKDFFRLLLLRNDHNLTDDQVKNLSNADSVSRLSYSCNLTSQQAKFLSIIESHLESIDAWQEGDGFDIFFIYGNHTNSKYFDLLPEYFIGAYEFSYADFFKSYKASSVIHYIHWIRERFSQAEFMHNEMMSDPDKQKICFRLDRMTKQLNLLTNKYAMHELQACEKIVRHILTNRW